MPVLSLKQRNLCVTLVSDSEPASEDLIEQLAVGVRKHRELILNWFRARKQYNSGIVEGISMLVKQRFRTALGFRTIGARENRFISTT